MILLARANQASHKGGSHEDEARSAAGHKQTANDTNDCILLSLACQHSLVYFILLHAIDIIGHNVLIVSWQNGIK